MTLNKALIEIPPKFAGLPPVHPPENKEQQLTWLKREWKGAEGLAEDVRYYGKWMRNEAEKSIGHLFPKIKITVEMLTERDDLRKQGFKPGDELTVIAWLWARTVKCPNPACGAQMPLARSFALSIKKGKQAWVEANIDRNSQTPSIHFFVKTGTGKPLEGTVNRNGAHCLACNIPVPLDYIRAEGQSKRMSAQLMAIVIEGKQDRLYIAPVHEHEILSAREPYWKPDQELQGKCRVSVPLYGMNSFGDLFTERQLSTLSFISEKLIEARNNIQQDAKVYGVSDPEDYANSIITYLAFSLDKMTTTNCTLCTWQTQPTRLVAAFSRQAIPMVWDYAEANPFSGAAGDYNLGVQSVAEVLERLEPSSQGSVKQQSATMLNQYDTRDCIISTDPPYYDNIQYADISDYFYVWLRKSLQNVYPDLFSTVLVPKSQEIVASTFRFNGDRRKANAFFEKELGKAFDQIYHAQISHYPLTVFYAFKQAEIDENEQDYVEVGLQVVSTGWESMLEGLMKAGFSITGTWPVRTELTVALKSFVSSLASSIVLVCRPRPESAPSITRRDFLSSLKHELPPALRKLQQGSIAPVDLAQAAIGPGMAVFSLYKQVLEADGSPMRVRAALGLINQALDEYLSEQEGEYDSDTRWALAWFEQYGHEQGPYGVAETLSTAKNTSVAGLSHAGFLEARGGKVRLLRRDELEKDWDPTKDKRLTAWEAAQYLIRALDKEGEKGAGALLGKLGSIGETARDLAYRLYTVCERKKWAQEALAYNMLVVAWPRIKEQSGKGPRQDSLL